MRLTELVVMCAVLVALMGGILSVAKRSVELSENVIEAERKAMCLTFVAESFCAACAGRGFQSLKDWQVSCRAMYKLDYIGFGRADSFMEDIAITSDGEAVPTLYYATWNGPYGDGEVYFRKKEEKN